MHILVEIEGFCQQLASARFTAAHLYYNYLVPAHLLFLRVFTYLRVGANFYLALRNLGDAQIELEFVDPLIIFAFPLPIARRGEEGRDCSENRSLSSLGALHLAAPCKRLQTTAHDTCIPRPQAGVLNKHALSMALPGRM
jgi:hypothetical protein